MCQVRTSRRSSSIFLDPYQTVALYSVMTSLVYLGINIFWGFYLGTAGRFAGHFLTSLGTAIALLIPLRWLAETNAVAAIPAAVGALGLYCLVALLSYRRNVNSFGTVPSREDYTWKSR